MKKVYWTTREGVKMDLDYMNPEHLKNAFKMLILAVEKDQQKRDLKRKKDNEFKLHGDIAQAHFDAMVDSECREMGFTNYDEYEYYLKSRGDDF
jgi:hypothetical protein